VIASFWVASPEVYSGGERLARSSPGILPYVQY
jgi:hypothetical protein